MVAREYVPDAGDLIWLDFTPQAGREQAGRRPAVVLSRRSYNEKTCLAVVFRSEPPCEVAHPRRDSLRPFGNLDWRQRQAQKAGKIPRSILEQVRARVTALLEIS